MTKERIYLRQRFLKTDGNLRTNILKCYMKEDGMQMFIDNGKSRTGVAIYAGIRLDIKLMKQLKEYLDSKLERMEAK